MSTCFEMKTAKVFANGRSQAVRIPREWLGGADEVELQRGGDKVVLRPIRASLGELSDRFQKAPVKIERVPQTTTRPRGLAQ
ncbi:MAG: AbrB/MazE/SpoVT family DNA-binding domain-containing protein [Verrucomicrobiota bacterium]